MGGAGANVLVGGSGDDLLVGGAGADQLVGTADDDILVGGSTAFDGDAEALDAILGVWADGAAGTAADRRQRLLAGILVGGRVVALDMSTVLDGGRADRVVRAGLVLRVRRGPGGRGN